MTKRRSLLEGLQTPAPRGQEEAFVYGTQAKAPAQPPKNKQEAAPVPLVASAPPAPLSTPNQLVNRSPLTTRIRSELASALKRASLQRQLSGELPHTVQEILEEALQPWLRDKGYLQD